MLVCVTVEYGAVTTKVGAASVVSCTKVEFNISLPTGSMGRFERELIDFVHTELDGLAAFDGLQVRGSRRLGTGRIEEEVNKLVKWCGTWANCSRTTSV